MTAIVRNTAGDPAVVVNVTTPERDTPVKFDDTDSTAGPFPDADADEAVIQLGVLTDHDVFDVTDTDCVSAPIDADHDVGDTISVGATGLAVTENVPEVVLK